MPEPQAEPEASAPDRIEQGHEAADEPERQDLMSLRILRPSGRQRDRPAEREDASHGKHHLRAHRTDGPEDEGKGERDDGDEITGHRRVSAAGGEPL